MKKIILLLMLSIAAFSCKNAEEKNPSEEITTENEETLPTYKGDFIDSDGAMVLMGTSFIYGVKRNALADELTTKVAAVKTNKFDMVNITVRGVVSKNTDKDSEWEEEITIKEILEVSNKPSEADIKLNESAKNN
jgi:hypothetical protein